MSNVVHLKMAAAGDDTENPDAVAISFDTFWKVYPKKLAKKDALKAWQKIPPENYQAVIDGVMKARKSDDWRQENGWYVPYAATYLNGERWLDELEADLTMGECFWNINNNREPGKPKCSKLAVKEKNGVAYCADHIKRVN